LVPDTYTLTVSANNYSTVNSGGLQVQAYQVVSQNFSLCQNAGAASFDYSPAFPALGETITFTATAQEGAPPLTYAWNYGDGNLGNGQVVTHAYQSRGAFQVNRSVDNICAVPSLASRPVIVDPELTYLPIVSGIP
jgi:PKD repeat protein